MIYITIGLGILFLISVYTSINLLIKIEKMEDAMIEQNKVMLSIDTNIKEAKKFIDSVDERGIFQADDEVGTFFGYLQEIQKTLNQYALNDDGTEEKE